MQISQERHDVLKLLSLEAYLRSIKVACTNFPPPFKRGDAPDFHSIRKQVFDKCFIFGVNGQILITPPFPVGPLQAEITPSKGAIIF